MKIAVVGAGAVGAAVTTCLVHQGQAEHIVLIDTNTARAHALALDLGHGTPLTPPVNLYAGNHDDAHNADLVLICAGRNERTGGATDRSDPQGRLRLLSHNADLYRDLLPTLGQVAPTATYIVVTDPPDPLAQLARTLLGHDRILATGTLIDSLRFRMYLARHFQVAPQDVHAQVIGEHGTSQVFLWSSATVAGTLALELAHHTGTDPDHLRTQAEEHIRYANITIIEGLGASQYGIGTAVAALAQCVLRNERRVLPVASYIDQYQVTLSLPSVVGTGGVEHVLHPPMSQGENHNLHAGAQALRTATHHLHS